MLYKIRTDSVECQIAAIKATKILSRALRLLRITKIENISPRLGTLIRCHFIREYFTKVIRDGTDDFWSTTVGRRASFLYQKKIKKICTYV